MGKAKVKKEVVSEAAATSTLLGIPADATMSAVDRILVQFIDSGNAQLVRDLKVLDMEALESIKGPTAENKSRRCVLSETTRQAKKDIEKAYQDALRKAQSVRDSSLGALNVEFEETSQAIEKAFTEATLHIQRVRSERENGLRKAVSDLISKAREEATAHVPPPLEEMKPVKAKVGK